MSRKTGKRKADYLSQFDCSTDVLQCINNDGRKRRQQLPVGKVQHGTLWFDVGQNKLDSLSWVFLGTNVSFAKVCHQINCVVESTKKEQRSNGYRVQRNVCCASFQNSQQTNDHMGGGCQGKCHEVVGRHTETL
jgi:hypothetical protein